MKAVRFHQYGDAEVLRFEDAPMPQFGENDVLIRVHASGVNPSDCQFRRGDYRAFVPLTLPFIPGWDVAGTIDAVGAKVTRFKPGDAVFAMADMFRNGAYAQYIAVRANEVAMAPNSLPPEQAAGVPLAALTAWKALFDDAALKAGQSVLVHAGAGGVGLFAIQLARRAGARVIATASAANHELLRQLGAHQVIDYRAGDFAAGLKDIDVVLDTVGGETRERSWPVLRPGGTLAAIAMPPPDEARARRHGVRAVPVRVQPHGERLADIARLIDAGELKVMIDRVLPLAYAAAAQRYSEERHARGKIILRIA
ncbi:NADP-dependent oxidoreductase [Piscinibacter sp.]|jgi:NADPH:quinone reductase-like Zn-dependent oxidoreductase|uniref:NADP-dependent oxidoreductase n=1 Tax=Piscinibacter sp. TaxID=1903157 RepID=UPI002F41EF95